MTLEKGGAQYVPIRWDCIEAVREAAASIEIKALQVDLDRRAVLVKSEIEQPVLDLSRRPAVGLFRIRQRQQHELTKRRHALWRERVEKRYLAHAALGFVQVSAPNRRLDGVLDHLARRPPAVEIGRAHV